MAIIASMFFNNALHSLSIVISPLRTLQHLGARLSLFRPRKTPKGTQGESL